LRGRLNDPNPWHIIVPFIYTLGNARGGSMLLAVSGSCLPGTATRTLSIRRRVIHVGYPQTPAAAQYPEMQPGHWVGPGRQYRGQSSPGSP
jgi:hypothetical protein